MAVKCSIFSGRNYYNGGGGGDEDEGGCVNYSSLNHTVCHQFKATITISLYLWFSH